MKFLEVFCKSSCKTRRFAAGTEAGFASSLINRNLDFGVPLALHIEAFKEGEEPVSFGPNSILVDYGSSWKLQTVMDEGVISGLEKRKRMHTIPEQFPTGMKFLEVVCKSSAKTRRFADGTEAGFALSLINRKLDFGVPLALHIEAVKEGEEPISFGPNSILVDYGDGWKLQTIVDEGVITGLEKRKGIHLTPEQFPTGLKFLEVVCKSSGKTRLFAVGTEAGFALSLINRKLDFGVPLALHIEAVKEGEEPVSFGPNSILVDYGDSWKLQTVMDEGIEKRKRIHPTPEQEQFPTGMESLAETLDSSVVWNDRIVKQSPADSVSWDSSLYPDVSFSQHNAQTPEFTPRAPNQTDAQQSCLMISQGPGQMHGCPLTNSPFHVPVQNHVQYQEYGGLIEHAVNQSHAVDDPDSVPMTKSSISENSTQTILNQAIFFSNFWVQILFLVIYLFNFEGDHT
ncbi:hypothetical protein HHK36_019915 [Tetracentron sinense]|uniref:Uncharacterized protein n=1 Tax=Tetracentron sinense TaxID=13715 RepID=A0A834YSM4_TETSI|nr:hypothetical protein HHK36_019915 [Tetracentron sinense]